MAEAEKPFRILALADLHDCVERLEPFRQIDADMIVFCGDLHNAGSRETSQPAALALAGLGLPVLIVPGNMDHRDVVLDLWNEAGLLMLHRTSFRFADLGFLGMGGMVAKDPRRLKDPARYYHRDEDVYETLARSHQDISDARIRIAVVHQPPRGGTRYPL